jgi:alpha-1,2-mannosyltransferase
MSAIAQVAYFVQLAAAIVGLFFIALLTRRDPTPKWVPIVIAAGCVALALLTFRISDPSYHFWDFHSAYYPAGKAVIAGAQYLREMTGLGVSGFVNLPVVAYVFAPFALLPEPMATHLFLAISLVAVGATWLILARIVARDTTDRWLLLLLFAANGPLLYSLKEGNTSHFILLAMVGGLALLRVARPAAAGAVLGAAAIIKPPLLLFGLFFLLRRDARGTLGFAAVCGVVVALSLAVFGWDDNLHWFEVCIVQFSHRWLAAFNVQSIPAFLFRFVAPAGMLEDWNSRLPPTDLTLPANILFVLLFALAAAALWRRARMSGALVPLATLELQYSLVICLVILASPLSWSHYYCWLLLPAALFLGWRRELRWQTRICGWFAILLVTPVVRLLKFTSPRLLEAYKDVGVSHLLLGAILWFGLIAWWLAYPPSPHSRKP